MSTRRLVSIRDQGHSLTFDTRLSYFDTKHFLVGFCKILANGSPELKNGPADGFGLKI